MRAYAAITVLILSAIFRSIPFGLNDASLTPHNPIHISSNADFTADNGVVGGSGTLNDPYIIEGWDITEVNIPLDYGIWLENTDAYVVIRNCLISQYVGIRLEHVANVVIENVTVRGGENSIYVYNSKNLVISNCDLGHCRGDAVQLTYSTNIKLKDCKIGDGRYHSVYMLYLNDTTVENCCIYDSLYGVYAESSLNITIRNCNIHGNLGDGLYFYVTMDCAILNCQVYSNEDHGIYLDSSSRIKIEYCDVRNSSLGIWLNPAFNCEIHFNNFINIHQNAQDDGQGNNWDKNYWSDYKGADNNNDGYGDTPYNIIGNANAKDNMPLIQVIPEFPHLMPLIVLLMMISLAILLHRGRHPLEPQ